VNAPATITRNQLPVEAGELPLTIARSAGTGAAVVIMPSAFGVGPDPLDRHSTREAAWAGMDEWSDRSDLLARTASLLALGAPLCAAVGAWRARRSWRRWPWLTLVAYAPAMVAFAYALGGMYFEARRSWALVATSAVCLVACAIDLRRLRQPGTGRMLAWSLAGVGAVSTGLLGFAALRYD
jgi:hypothetical protein